MRVTRIFADADGVSHFEHVDVPIGDAGEIGRLSEPVPATGLIFRETAPDYDYDWHPAPRRQYIVLLEGEIEIDGRKRRTTRDRLVPFCMFTDPELARVGLNEKEAKSTQVAFRTARLPMAAVLRTRTTSEPRGFMKMLVAEDSDRILGFTVFGSEASELLATVQTAMLGGLPFTSLRDALFTHPTAAEGLTVLLADLERRVIPPAGSGAPHTRGRRPP